LAEERRQDLRIQDMLRLEKQVVASGREQTGRIFLKRALAWHKARMDLSAGLNKPKSRRQK